MSQNFPAGESTTHLTDAAKQQVTTLSRHSPRRIVQLTNLVGLCDSNDWRMPHVGELQSIAYFGKQPIADIDNTCTSKAGRLRQRAQPLTLETPPNSPQAQ